ncbi:LysR family transcriptional regulator [Euzebya tangerina]|uniref:LysR family transcriptional regulator n=1 Tax=Euzebya tangerina TaxID=591198 RepID=UPI000E31EBBC|nr:LysR family transcriptional regulator [Euzebya tangerina]
MEFRELEAFVAVAEELHFGEAARRLHVSQSALSEQIRRLEADLGTELLHRTSRRVELSAAGVVFLERCRALLEDAALAVESTRRAADGSAGHLRIGYVGSTLYGVVPVVVGRMRRTHPGVTLELVERKTAPQVETLRDGTQDIGFVHRPPTEPDGLALHDLEDEAVHVVMPDGHALADPTGAIGWGELAGHDVVLFPRDLEPDTYDLFVDGAARAGVTLQVVQEATGLPTILGLVRAGIGIAFVVESVAETLDPAVFATRELATGLRVTIALAWDPDSTNPAVSTILRLALPAGA